MRRRSHTGEEKATTDEGLEEIVKQLNEGCPNCGHRILHIHMVVTEVVDGSLALGHRSMEDVMNVNREITNEELELECTECGKEIELDD